MRILHFPINVLFAFFVDGRYTLIDPTSDEERSMDGFVSISMNQHKEICGIHMGGKLGLKREQMDICKKLALKKVVELTEHIREAVRDYYKSVEVHQSKNFNQLCSRNIEPVTHTQPSIVRIEDDDDEDESRSPSESEDVVLSKPEISPSSMENSDTVNAMFLVTNLVFL